MFQFHYPWFSLLIPLPLLLLWIFPKRSKEQCPEIFFPKIQQLKETFKTSFGNHKYSIRWSSYLLTLVWIFIIFALMQPETVDQLRTVKNKGYDLLLAVDISGSMQAVDFSTQNKIVSRLDATKQVVGQFVSERQGDRIGLILFGEHAYLHVPLTLDTASVSNMLEGTVSGMAGSATAIGDAIGLSVRTLRDRPKESRILILLTDGEDNASSIPPLEAAKLAKQYGIKIYTIAIGKNGQVPFPAGNGRFAMVNISIDEKLLKEIAEMTGGQFYMATDQKALASIYATINTLEKTEANESIHLLREPLFQYPLSIAAALLFCITLFPLSNRRKVYGA